MVIVMIIGVDRGHHHGRNSVYDDDGNGKNSQYGSTGFLEDILLLRDNLVNPIYKY